MGGRSGIRKVVRPIRLKMLFGTFGKSPACRLYVVDSPVVWIRGDRRFKTTYYELET